MTRWLVPSLVLLSLGSLCVAITTWSMLRRPAPIVNSGTAAQLDAGFAAIPDFTLTQRDSQSVSRSQLDGQVWIAGFIFTRCPSTCPMVTGVMARLRKELPAEIQLVSFSVDPEIDTPEVLTEYAKDYDPRTWWFLTGDRDTLYTLIREGFKLGVRENPDFGKQPGEKITHSTRLALVDKRGNLRGYFDSSDQAQVDQLLRRAKELMNE